MEYFKALWIKIETKQFETKKDLEKINNICKSSKLKRPVYDARKAIEEAKLKEEKNKGKK